MVRLLDDHIQPCGLHRRLSLGDEPVNDIMDFFNSIVFGVSESLREKSIHRSLLRMRSIC